MGIPVKLEVFEGPLDLLLHLIDKNKIDIYDIPIVEITNQYMEYIRNTVSYTHLDVYKRQGIAAAVSHGNDDIFGAGGGNSSYGSGVSGYQCIPCLLYTSRCV